MKIILYNTITVRFEKMNESPPPIKKKQRNEYEDGFTNTLKRRFYSKDTRLFINHIRQKQRIIKTKQSQGEDVSKDIEYLAECKRILKRHLDLDEEDMNAYNRKYVLSIYQSLIDEVEYGITTEIRPDVSEERFHDEARFHLKQELKRISMRIFGK